MTEEIDMALRKMKNNRLTGEDDIVVEAIKVRGTNLAQEKTNPVQSLPAL